MLASGDALRISTQCEEHVCQPNMRWFLTQPVSFVTTTMVKFWTGTNNESTRIGKTGVPTRRHKSKKPSTEGDPHARVQQIQEKPGQVESRDTR